ncbi:oxidoreductase [Terribacillus sp. DMT04]|uniref:oxidoreductase n=1 Tax=Terribacillus sp. DMT04 TaxID=2850441 RepID=UPI001C2CA122|nr:oxidoreductase [Terribacillus sp. DMT04]QXE00630.1 oxidoreductase [Terribacillus sp. DMT04]
MNLTGNNIVITGGASGIGFVFQSVDAIFEGLKGGNKEIDCGTFSKAVRMV